MVESRVVGGQRTWTPEEVRQIVKKAKEEVEIRDRSYHLVSYQKCFVASELADFTIA